MTTVTLSEDTALDLLTLLWTMAATLDNTRQLLQVAEKHLPGELRYEAQECLAQMAFIAGLTVSEN